MEVSELEPEFERIESVSVKRDIDGEVEIQYPQERYSKSTEKDLHPHGQGPFCDFDINTSEYEEKSGVFLISINRDVKYVGASANLGKYIYDIGNISPSACYEDGQQTVCRINTKILHATRRDEQVSVWAYKTTHPQGLKSRIRRECDPAWNRH